MTEEYTASIFRVKNLGQVKNDVIRRKSSSITNTVLPPSYFSIHLNQIQPARRWRQYICLKHQNKPLQGVETHKMTILCTGCKEMGSNHIMNSKASEYIQMICQGRKVKECSLI
jgi:hypothetical protein